MIAATSLLLFLMAATLLLLAPGPNMAFVLAHGMAHGWRGGLAAALGIAVADLLLTALTAGGVTALVSNWPPSFDIVRFAGVFYLLWLAQGALRHRGGGAEPPRRPLPGLRAVFLRALLNSLLNPKALLFFMVFLPQFVAPGHAPVGVQLAIFGALLALIALVFHSCLGALGGRLGDWLRRRPAFAAVQARLTGLLMLGLAARLALLSRP